MRTLARHAAFGHSADDIDHAAFAIVKPLLRIGLKLIPTDLLAQR